MDFKVLFSTARVTGSQRIVLLWLIAGWSLFAAGGCSTLATLGLPVANPPNAVLRSAKQISETAVCAAPLPRELNETVLAEYRVEPGDVLFIEPAKFDSPARLPGDQSVQPDGTVELGRFGRLNVVNKTTAEIQAEVQVKVEAIEPKAGPINVRLINWESKTFYVLGEVNSPGSFQFDGNETVLDAIVEAGGLNRSANHHRILLSRPTPEGSCRIVLPVCYDQIVQLGDSSTNYQLLPGDRVFVSSISLMDDIKQSLFPFWEHSCPRCAAKPYGCNFNAMQNSSVNHVPPVVTVFSSEAVAPRENPVPQDIKLAPQPIHVETQDADLPPSIK